MPRKTKCQALIVLARNAREKAEDLLTEMDMAIEPLPMAVATAIDGIKILEDFAARALAIIEQQES